MKITLKNITKDSHFLEKNGKNKFIIFGFTSNIFTHLIERLPKGINSKELLSNAMIIHGMRLEKFRK